MKHVSSPWLRRIRLGIYGYIVFVLASYSRLVQVNPEHIYKTYGYTLLILVLGIAGVQIIYEVAAKYILFKRQEWPKAFITLAFAFAETFLIMAFTGGPESPFIVGVYILVFIASAIGVYTTIFIIASLVLGLIVGITGVLGRLSSITTAIIGLLISCVIGVIGYFVWKRYYGGRTNSLDTLSSSLSKEQAKSDIILNSIEDGVILIDTNKVIRLFNPGAVAITGWPAEEAMGLDYHSVLHLVSEEKNSDYTEEQNPFSRVLAENKNVRDNQAILVSRSEKLISLNLNVSPLFDSANNLTGAVGIFRDVSEERTEEKRRAEFISTASHEMRTPVAAIEGYLALALNEKVSKIDTHARDYLQKAHESTQHLGKLFQDLLTSAKAEDGRLSNHPSIVEMGEYLEKLADGLRFAAEKKGLHMEFVIGTPDQTVIDASSGVGGNKIIRPFYYVSVDAERIREVITNLFDNAVKYTETGNVSIGLTGNDEVVQIYIRDTGPGIPAEDMPHLFQKFYRVDSSATRTIGGTGLGLFISRKIVELYNGRVWVESDLGKGSTFFINLPRVSTQKATQLQAVEASNTSPLSATGNI